MKALNRSTIPAPVSRYPIRVIQFGAGRFQRGFTNWIIQILNQQSNFRSNVIVVKPTEKGDYDQLRSQDGLYHVALSHSIQGQVKYDISLITNIARIIHPYLEWQAFLQTAQLPDIKFIISNTTEAGINIKNFKNIDLDACPVDYPVKLAYWLYHRFQFFKGASDKGCYVLPLELIQNNGKILQSCIEEIAHKMNGGNDFIKWLHNDNHFCTTLVDRIVTGFPEKKASFFRTEIGYEDQLIVQGERYHTLIIQGPAHFADDFPMQAAPLHIQLVEDITPFYEIKVRILNGMHTSLVGIGLLGGFELVNEAVAHPAINSFLKKMVLEEVIPTIQYDNQYLNEYFEDTMLRFSNQELHHKLENIALNTTSKFMVRLYTTLLDYLAIHNHLPHRITFVLACILMIYKNNPVSDNYNINDDANKLERLQALWHEQQNLRMTIQSMLSQELVWGTDMNNTPGLLDEVVAHFTLIENLGWQKALESLD